MQRSLQISYRRTLNVVAVHKVPEVAMDKMILGKPDPFYGGIENRVKWRTWARVFTSYCSAIHEHYTSLLREVEQQQEPISQAVLSEEVQQLSRQLYRTLTMILKDSALETLMSV